MPKTFVVVLLLCVLWTGFSWYWYTCGIKGFCGEVELVVTITQHTKENPPVDTNQLITVADCANYISLPLSYSRVNDTEEIQKLNYFLSEVEDYDIDASWSEFSDDTFIAVNAFQQQYKTDILTPLGLTESTGNVYGQTIKKINERYCEEVTGN